MGLCCNRKHSWKNHAPSSTIFQGQSGMTYLPYLWSYWWLWGTSGSCWAGWQGGMNPCLSGGGKEKQKRKGSLTTQVWSQGTCLRKDFYRKLFPFYSGEFPNSRVSMYTDVFYTTQCKTHNSTKLVHIILKCNLRESAFLGELEEEQHLCWDASNWK